jgi:hypothetical protein
MAASLAPYVFEIDELRAILTGKELHSKFLFIGLTCG